MDKIELLKKVADNELLQFLGVKIEVAKADRVVLKMEVTPRVHQYLGIMNGGVSLYLAETAASIGVVAAADLEKVSPVGIEINANHLRAVSKGTLTVEAKPIIPGRTERLGHRHHKRSRQARLYVAHHTSLAKTRRLQSVKAETRAVARVCNVYYPKHRAHSLPVVFPPIIFLCTSLFEV